MFGNDRFVWIAAALMVLSASALRSAEEWKRLVDLRGEWRFRSGDDVTWAAPAVDDAGWDTIFVPAPWEGEGYAGYDGFAWYRREFALKARSEREALYLCLGRIDDVDAVYLNGHYLGFHGEFPPFAESAWFAERRYRIPVEWLAADGRNVIAVRVYDEGGEGGLVAGAPGVYQAVDYLYPDVDLSRGWRLARGDDDDWSRTGAVDGPWKPVVVPAYWETQGLPGYDGVAWYRLEFDLPGSMSLDDQVLLLGRIDDMDDVYLNGERVGRTGRDHRHSWWGEGWGGDESWLRPRVYPLPDGLLVHGRNVLAVRVVDTGWHGGIYDGPVGLVTRDRWREYRGQAGRKDRMDMGWR